MSSDSPGFLRLPTGMLYHSLQLEAQDETPALQHPLKNKEDKNLPAWGDEVGKLKGLHLGNAPSLPFFS